MSAAATGRLARWWGGWVDFWREVEGPEALAAGRITFGLAVVANALEQLLYSGVVELYATPEAGGIFSAGRAPLLSLYRWIDPSAEAAWALGLATLVAGVGLTLGLFTRVMAGALVILHITLVGRLGLFSFSADTVYRVFSFMMLVAPVGAALSLDAAWRGKGRASVPRWPRRLILFQLTVVYVVTGLLKVGSTWSFGDGFSALYYALNLPYFAWRPGEWAATVYPLTQIGTIVTRWWETLFFLLPLSLYLRRRPKSGGRLRRALARYDLRLPFLGVGFILHASLVVVMKLGLFPFVMLSLYPFFLEPCDVRCLLKKAFARK